MFFFMFKEIKFRFFYFFSGIFFNFFILYSNRTQFFYLTIKPLYFSFERFSWDFSYASPFESFSIFLFFCFILSFFFSYPGLLVHVFIYILPGFNKKKQFILFSIMVFSFFFFIFSFFFCFNFILPSIYSFCFKQDVINSLFDLSFFPIIYPYLLFTLKILYSFFFFFQLPVFFLFFILKKKVNVTFFIQNRKHFFIFCLVFGTFFSTPEVLNQIILSCILLFFFEVILFFSFIRFFLIRLKEG